MFLTLILAAISLVTSLVNGGDLAPGFLFLGLSVAFGISCAWRTDGPEGQAFWAVGFVLDRLFIWLPVLAAFWGLVYTVRAMFWLASRVCKLGMLLGRVTLQAMRWLASRVCKLGVLLGRVILAVDRLLLSVEPRRVNYR